MEEIGMEKLIELLNEFAPEDFNWCVIDGKIYDKEMGYSEYDVPLNVEMGVYIISKQFGFIKWLVENDKIDFKKDAFVSLASELGCTAKDEKIVLMVLSISDTPIEDLISYLR